MGLLLGGAALVALVSLGFAWLADKALEWNRAWVGHSGWLALLIRRRRAALRWLTCASRPTRRAAASPSHRRLVATARSGTAWSRWFRHCGSAAGLLGMLAGASIGREGPSVQVGAAVMLAWGDFLEAPWPRDCAVSTPRTDRAGAAGGLRPSTAAFNAPLAGVIFAIEELGRGTVLRWQRLVLIGVLAAGFLVVAVAGNNPYFGVFAGEPLNQGMLMWVLVCGALNGALGGIFARLLGKGAGAAPRRWRAWIRAHPVWTAFIMGLALALIGLCTAGSVYGTGYGSAAGLLSGTTACPPASGWLLAATVASYWAGIPGGIFTPALTTGAGIGHHIWQLAGDGVDQRVLVLLSMAAFLAAATQAPDRQRGGDGMTGSQPMLFWLLVGALLASGVSRQFCPQPFYHRRRRFRRQALVEAGRAAKPATSPVGGS